MFMGARLACLAFQPSLPRTRHVGRRSICSREGDIVNHFNRRCNQENNSQGVNEEFTLSVIIIVAPLNLT